jgi:hypothetical protein
VRFKDLLGRKPEPDVSTGRLITTPAAPVEGRTSAPASAHQDQGELRRDRPDSLADVFAHLLAAEQGESPPPPARLPTRLSDEDVERISARVASRLADGPLRADVQRIVGEVAERLVREEIARIRGAAESESS